MELAGDEPAPAGGGRGGDHLAVEHVLQPGRGRRRREHLRPRAVPGLRGRLPSISGTPTGGTATRSARRSPT
jgi:hypothetical protein